MRQILQILMIFIVVCSSSSHLAVMQAFAWTGMLLEHVQEDRDFGEAISRTFDGDNPCGLCQRIDQASQIRGGQEDEEAPLPTAQGLDIKLLPLERLVVVPPVPDRLGLTIYQPDCLQRATRPRVPPPRRA